MRSRSRCQPNCSPPLMVATKLAQARTVRKCLCTFNRFSSISLLSRQAPGPQPFRAVVGRDQLTDFETYKQPIHIPDTCIRRWPSSSSGTTLSRLEKQHKKANLNMMVRRCLWLMTPDSSLPSTTVLAYYIFIAGPHHIILTCTTLFIYQNVTYSQW